MTSVDRWCLAVVGGLAWGLALPGPLGAGLVVVGALAWAGGARGDIWRSTGFSVAWYGAATVGWWGDTWSRFGAPSPWSLWLIFLLVSSIAPVIGSVGARASAGWREVVAAIGAGAAIEGLQRGLSPAPLGPALLAVGAPVLEWPTALGGRSLFAALLLGWAVLAWRRVGWSLVAAAAWVAVGAVWLADADAPTVKVSVLQPNIGAFAARVSSLAPERDARVAELAKRAVGIGFLPEGAWSGRAPPPATSGMDYQGWNAVVAPGGAAFGKRFLVPVAERAWFGLGRDRYIPGDLPRRLVVAGVVVAPLVCYEDMLPSAIAEISVDTTVLYCPTNDGWLGPGRASELHFAGTRLAAVESGRWAVRPAMCGPSGIVDRFGRVILRSRWEDADRAPFDGLVLAADIATVVPAWCGSRIDAAIGALGICLIFGLEFARRLRAVA
jgi:hypothetical protein